MLHDDKIMMRFIKIVRNRIVSMILLFAALFAAGAWEGISAQDVQKIKLRAHRGRGHRDKNIRKPAKPVTHSKGKGIAQCTVTIMNNTAELVDVYIRDQMQGSLRSKNFGVSGGFTTVVDAGRMKIYARTRPIIIDFFYWGPDYQTCGSATKDGSITVEINPSLKM